MRLIPFVLACFIVAGTAQAEVGSLNVSLGYAHAFLPGRGAGLPEDGFCIDGDWLFRLPGVAVPPLGIPLWLGAGGSFGLFDNHGWTGEQRPGTRTSYLGLFSLEARAAAPIRLGASHQFFVTPELGAGALLNFYGTNARLDELDQVTTEPNHTGAAFALEPGIRAGYSWGAFSAGAEVCYLAAWGDFGRVGGQVQELHAGVFLQVTF